MAIATLATSQRTLNVIAGVSIPCNFALFAETDVRVVYGDANLPATLNADYTVTLTDDRYSFVITPLASLINKMEADAQAHTVYIYTDTNKTTSAVPGLAGLANYIYREFERVAVKIQELYNRGVVKVKFGVVPPVIAETIAPGRVLQMGDDNEIVEGQDLGSIGDSVEAAQAAAELATEQAAIAVAAASEAVASQFLSIFGILGIEGGAVGSESSKFTALEAAYTGYAIDGRGRTYNVSSIPNKNRYFNGYWEVPNSGGSDHNVAVRYPMADTISMRRKALVTPGTEAYESWPQAGITVSNVWGNIIFGVGYSSGTGSGSPNNVYEGISDDFGATVYAHEPVSLMGGDGYGCWCATGGSMFGQKFRIVRTRNYTTGTTIDFKLMAQRAYERRRDASISVTTVAGSSDLIVNLSNYGQLGILLGNRIRISGVASFDGVDLTQIMTVSVTGAASLTLTTGSATTATAGMTATIVVTIIFIQDAWAELKFANNTQSLGVALLALAGTPYNAQPISMAGMALTLGAFSGTMRFTAHGGGVGGPCVITIASLFRLVRNLSSVKRISQSPGVSPPLLTTGGEGEMARSLANDTYIALRGDIGAPSQLVFSNDDDVATKATAWLLPLNFGVDSNIPICFDEANQMVYLTMSDSRGRDYTPGTVPLYLAWMTKVQFAANAGLNFKPVHILDMWNAAANSVPQSSAAGVPAMVLYDNSLFISYSSAHGARWTGNVSDPTEDNDGRPQVRLIEIAIGPKGPTGAKIKERMS